MPSRHSIRDSKTQSKKPFKLEDPKIRAAAIKAYASMMPDRGVCARIGVNPTTWVEWKNRAKQGDEFFVKFFEEADTARAKEEMRLLGNIKKAGVKEWRAAAWLLERTCGYVLRTEITGGDGKPLAAGVLPPVTVVVSTAPGSEPLVNPYAMPPMEDSQDEQAPENSG